MHCDQVFNILTQGPFPTGQAIDAAVERHLDCCHECFELAEALRPAVDLFHESISDEDSDRLPEYRGSIDSSPHATLPETIRALIESPASRLPRESNSRGPMRVFARENAGIASFVLLLALGLGTGLYTLTRPNQTTLAETNISDSLQHSRTVRSSGLTLAQLNLSEACFKLPIPPGLTSSAKQSGASGTVQCCTICHNAANPRRPRIDSIAILEKSCRGCHTP